MPPPRGEEVLDHVASSLVVDVGLADERHLRWEHGDDFILGVRHCDQSRANRRGVANGIVVVSSSYFYNFHS
jgi:hypothetical protein